MTVLRRRLGSFLAVAIGSMGMSSVAPTILTPGMELQYESNGRVGAPWKVETVEPDLTIAGRSGCLRVRFAPGGPRQGADVRITCEGEGMLWSLDTASGAWRASRPLVSGGTLEVRAGARSSRYTVGEASTVMMDGLSLRVLETTVLTVDSSGAAVRRLRERYAPALGTAVWGTFEVPYGAQWSLQQEFRLTSIRVPPRD